MPRHRKDECDQCGDPPEDGDELVRCISCDEDCCTTVCIAGRGVECFQCEQRNAEREDADRHDVDPFDDDEDDFPDEDEFPNDDGEDD